MSGSNIRSYQLMLIYKIATIIKITAEVEEEIPNPKEKTRRMVERGCAKVNRKLEITL